MSEPRQPVELRHTHFSTDKINKIRWLAEKASRAVHSNGHMITADKKQVLGLLSALKKECDSLLQLSMFSPEQLE